MFKTVRQKVTLKASPKKIYALLMDADKHSALIGAPVALESVVGGKLSAWDGAIKGINVELTPGKRIVQMWRSEDWPEGHYSTATFELQPIDGGTQLVFTQTGVPASMYDDIVNGWKSFYWQPMKAALKG